MTIHKEGYTSIALCILIIFVVNAFLQFYFPGAIFIKWFVYTLSVGFFISTVVFFISPSITIATNDAAVLSPADGTIVAIEEAEETEFLNGRAIKISIAIGRNNQHVNRNPVKGIVKYASATNSNSITAVENADGTAVVYKQVGGGLTKRVISHLKAGDTVVQGAKFGFAMLGARVDVYLPTGTTIDVDIDDKVKGGQTVLARFSS